jgi:hypothetical protein
LSRNFDLRLSFESWIVLVMLMILPWSVLIRRSVAILTRCNEPAMSDLGILVRK